MRRIARTLLTVTVALVAASSVARAQNAAPAPAPAATQKAVEVVMSTIFQQHQSSFSGLDLQMRVRMPQLIEGFSIAPTIEYWRNTSTLSDFGLEATRKDATLAALLRYDFKREGWQPYFGAGLGLHFLSSHVNAPSLGLNDASESVTKGGVALLGGINFGLAGNLDNMLELEYHGIGEQSQLKLNWGLAYKF